MCINLHVTSRREVEKCLCCRYRNIERTVTWRCKDGLHWKAGDSSHPGSSRSGSVLSKSKEGWMGNRINQSIWWASTVWQGKYTFCHSITDRNLLSTVWIYPCSTALQQKCRSAGRSAGRSVGRSVSSVCSPWLNRCHSVKQRLISTSATLWWLGVINL